MKLHRFVFALVFALCALVLLAGCGHKAVSVAVPPAPSIGQQTAAESSADAASETSAASDVASDAKPLLIPGIASWWGAVSPGAGRMAKFMTCTR